MELQRPSQGGWPATSPTGDRGPDSSLRQGEFNLRYSISDTTVGNVLKQHGIEPAPDRRQGTAWKTFLKAHWDVSAAIDFTTVEVWSSRGLVTFYLLLVMELKTRRVCFAGMTVSPDDGWMKQIARELTNCEDGFLPDRGGPRPAQGAGKASFASPAVALGCEANP